MTQPENQLSKEVSVTSRRFQCAGACEIADGATISQFGLDPSGYSDTDVLRVSGCTTDIDAKGDEKRINHPAEIVFLESTTNAILIIAIGEGESVEIPIDGLPIDNGEVIIGRSPDATVRIPSMQVSAMHARVSRRQDGLVTLQVNSSNESLVTIKRLAEASDSKNQEQLLEQSIDESGMRGLLARAGELIRSNADADNRLMRQLAEYMNQFNHIHSRLYAASEEQYSENYTQNHMRLVNDLRSLIEMTQNTVHGEKGNDADNSTLSVIKQINFACEKIRVVASGLPEEITIMRLQETTSNVRPLAMKAESELDGLSVSLYRLLEAVEYSRGTVSDILDALRVTMSSVNDYSSQVTRRWRLKEQLASDLNSIKL